VRAYSTVGAIGAVSHEANREYRLLSPPNLNSLWAACVTVDHLYYLWQPTAAKTSDTSLEKHIDLASVRLPSRGVNQDA